MNKQGVTLYLHVHQPWRVQRYTVFDTASRHDYFLPDGLAEHDNQTIFKKVADKSYRPMNRLLEQLLNEQPEFRLSLSITGVFIEQAQQWAPDVIESFQRMVQTGRVEIVAETYYHSLSFFYSRSEFEAQVESHRQKIREVFGVEVSAFRNTELAYNDELAAWAEQAGFSTIITEGWDSFLGWRSPNFVYTPANTEHIRLLLKNYRLSDDIAFRFSNKSWNDYPLTSEKYIGWLTDSLADGAQTVNLFMDYETFGEHQWANTGIFEFFGEFVKDWLAHEERTFYTISEAAWHNEPQGSLSVPSVVTWADRERDLSAWMGNSLQREALRYLYSLEKTVLDSEDIDIISDWRHMQLSDHVYYMSTKQSEDGTVHQYFSPYKSPYDAFLYYMNALHDIRYRAIEASRKRSS